MKKKKKNHLKMEINSFDEAQEFLKKKGFCYTDEELLETIENGRARLEKSYLLDKIRKKYLTEAQAKYRRECRSLPKSEKTFPQKNYYTLFLVDDSYLNREGKRIKKQMEDLDMVDKIKKIPQKLWSKKTREILYPD